MARRRVPESSDAAPVPKLARPLPEAVRRAASARGSTGEPNALVAAAKPLRIRGRGIAKQLTDRRQDWQVDCWRYFEEIPEFKHGVWWIGNAMAKLRLYVGVSRANGEGDPWPVYADTPEGEDPIDQALASAAIETLARLRNDQGGAPNLQRAIGMNFKIAGECYLVRIAPRTTADPNTGESVSTREEWFIKSLLEIEAKSDRIRVRDSDGKWLDLDDAAGDRAITLWQQHPGYSWRADTHARALLTDFEIALALLFQQKAEAWSRASAGVVLVPNELTFAAPDAGSGSDTDLDGDDLGDFDENDEAVQSDPLLEAIQAQLSGPVEDPSDPATLTPLLIRGPGEHLERFRHVTFARTSDSTLDQRIESCTERIARGLPLPVETTMGHQQTTFANAEQVDQDTFDDYLEPDSVLMVDSLTIAYLREELYDQGFDVAQVDRLCIWYDPKRLVKPPRKDAHAVEAYDRGELAGAAFRDALGFDEGDAPDAIERVLRLIERRAVLPPDITTGLLAQVLEVFGVPMPEPGPDAPAPTQEQLLGQAMLAALLAHPDGWGHPTRALGASTPAPLTAGAKANVAKLGRDLMEIDRDLRTRLLVQSNAAMERALDRAGARVRNKARTDFSASALVADVPNRRVTKTLGRARVLDLAGGEPADLIDDAFDALERPFMDWVGQAGQAALDLIERVTGGLSKQRRHTHDLRMLDDAAEAWQWLKAKLAAVAHDELFEAAAVPALGEISPALVVAPDIIRTALAIAGGGSGVEATGTGGARVIIQQGNLPVGGVASGQSTMGLLAEEGYGVEAYEWVYGPALRMRPFEPHIELDGVTFANFDDPVLTNTSGFPDVAFYAPGDHQGCLCDFVAIIVPPGG